MHNASFRDYAAELYGLAVNAENKGQSQMILKKLLSLITYTEMFCSILYSMR